MKIKTSELTGAALDWAVAKCEGIVWEQGDLDAREYGPGFKPSTDWAHGGPIIEREGIAIDCVRCDGRIDSWVAALPMICEASYEECGPSPLIAAMRCLVASKLGDEIEIPDELQETQDD